ILSPPSPAPERQVLRIVVRAHDARVAREAQALLAAAEVQAAAMPGAYRAAPDGEDIALFAALDGDVAAAVELAAAAYRTERRPLASLLALKSARPSPAGLEALAPFTGAIALDAP